MEVKKSEEQLDPFKYEEAAKIAESPSAVEAVAEEKPTETISTTELPSSMITSSESNSQNHNNDLPPNNNDSIPTAPARHSSGISAYPYPMPMKMYLTTITEELDPERIISGLREQNAKLTEQLHTLNEQVTDILRKQSRKAVAKQQLEQNTTDSAVLQKQLDTAYKRIEILTKQNKFQVSRIEKLSPENLTQLESLVKEKDATITKLNEEIKSRDVAYRLLNKNGNVNNDSKALEQTSKVEEFERQITHLTGEVRRLKNSLETQAKMVIRKQEHLVDLEQRYRECLDFLGIASTHPVKNSLKEELALRVVHQSKQSRPVLTELHSPSSNQKHPYYFDRPQQNISSQQQQQPQQPQVQVSLQKETLVSREIHSIVKLKDKEIEGLKAQISELRGIPHRPPRMVVSASQSGLSPLINSSKRVISSGKLKPNLPLENSSSSNPPSSNIRVYSVNNGQLISNSKKEVQSIHPSPSIKYVKKSVWGKQEGISKWMSDREILQDKLDVQIVRVDVWSNSRGVNGVQFFYCENILNQSTSATVESDAAADSATKATATSTKNLIEGNRMLVDKNEQYTRMSWDGRNKGDSIVSVACVISPQGCIDRLLFKSVQGESFLVGNNAKTEKSMQVYDCAPGQSLVCAFAGLITFVDEMRQESGGILACLGFDVLSDLKDKKSNASNTKGFQPFNLQQELMKKSK